MSYGCLSIVQVLGDRDSIAAYKANAVTDHLVSAKDTELNYEFHAEWNIHLESMFNDSMDKPELTFVFSQVAEDGYSWGIY